MKRIIVVFLMLAAFSYQANAQAKPQAKPAPKAATEPIILIKTDMGDIKVKLYNETPIHRDNFLKLASEGKYDGSIFHRVIPQFMVQGGGKDGGSGDLGSGTLAAEINARFVHTRGALAAARMGDNVNPEKRSSNSQFYIVQGRPFTEADIKAIGQRSGFPYTEQQIAAYVKNGGAPHLDGGYTVFGEVIEGLEVIDKIAAVQRNPQDKPLQDIKMSMKVLKK
jgi:cyclophilin family peptidyl-prolyl cis-trans isomerase